MFTLPKHYIGQRRTVLFKTHKKSVEKKYPYSFVSIEKFADLHDYYLNV